MPFPYFENQLSKKFNLYYKTHLSKQFYSKFKNKLNFWNFFSYNPELALYKYFISYNPELALYWCHRYDYPLLRYLSLKLMFYSLML